ncbi:MAG: symmetrical bis(5'-nucleosyl)-tetraphosphatase [Burkholderiaceae bacterium]
MDYLMGDLQGCCDPLDRLLATIGFSPSRDRIHLLGDLVNRGPQSLRVLERLAGLGDAAECLLGNHDLHLLGVAHGVRRQGKGDTLDAILADPRRDRWLDWLRHRRMAAQACGWLLVHAGVVPSWTAQDTLAHAAEIERLLRSPDIATFLPVMYGNEPRRWDAALEGPDRWRFIVNTLTRLRLCSVDDELDLASKEGPGAAPPGMRPWFDHPGRRTKETPIAFGHWSALGLVDSPRLLAIDTGCIWGGALTAVRVDGGRREVIQVECRQEQSHG